MKKPNSIERMTATQSLAHSWLKTGATVVLDKRRLKRYVIKKRWIKAVNTILALRRMGAKLEGVREPLL